MLALLAVVALASVAGCSGGYTKNLSQRELVVQFVPGATQAQHEKVMQACTGTANATPEPMPTQGNPATMLNNVRFRIDYASDADINTLINCVQKFPSVRGFRDEQPGGNG